MLNRRICIIALAAVIGWTACGGCGPDPDPDGMDTGGMPDVVQTGDMGGDDSGDTGTTPTTDEVIVACAGNTWAPPAAGLCDVTAGTGPSVLFQVGAVLAADAIYENGTVLMSGTAGDATITCVGCDCADQAQGPTVITCAEGVLSPALINPHDHLTFSLSWPQGHDDERFEHRHDWRRGLRGHTDISNSPRGDSSHEGVLYGELRHLFGGATSIIGATGAADSVAGLLRNLGNSEGFEGLTDVDVFDTTFPLGDFGGELESSGCNYPDLPDSARTANAKIYMPHIAEGIDGETRNEFLCLSSDTIGVNVVRANTSIVHAMALKGEDIAALASVGAKVVWNPRSNVDLYGNSARVTMMKNLGITIALGTDWSASGSINLLRELKCADYLNTNHFDNAFTNRELFNLATANAAIAVGTESALGSIAQGYVADLTLFDGSVGENYRAVIDANTPNVHLVVRGGTPLLGDSALVEGLVPAAELDLCEPLDVCGVERRLCVERDAGLTLAQIRAAVSQNAYPIFYCDEPDREPSCVPFRSDEYEGATADDPDGDGISTADDLCPTVFSPVRPIDDDLQCDFDQDLAGDACDDCPLSAEDVCAAADPNDRDGDGVPNVEDNCPADPNEGQENEDNDPYGDVCDPCLGVDNTASRACPATIYQIRAGEFGEGDTVFFDEVIVTGLSDRAYFVQVDPSASYYTGVDGSGLYIFGGTLPAVGDIVALEGTLIVFGDTLELVPSSMSISSSGNPLPPFTVVSGSEVSTGGARAAALEATLVRLRDVTVTSANPDAPDDFGEFEVDGLRVDDLFHLVEPAPVLGDQFAIIQGALIFSFSDSKLIPRNAADIVTGPPSLDSLQPAQAFLRSGTTAATVPPLQIVLTGPSLGSTTVNLAYAGNVSGPASLAVPDGESIAALPLTAAGVGSGTVTAMLDTDMSVAQVTVYDDASVRGVASVTPATSTVSTNASAPMTVELTVPAATGGQAVALAYSAGVSGPASVMVPQDQVTAGFTLTAGPNPGAETVTASIGGSMQTADVTVAAGTPNCLIISEYIEGSGSNNKAFELYNCSGDVLQLDDFGVCLVSNANTTCTATAALPAQALPVAGVFTICRNASGNAGDPVDGIANNCTLESGGVSNFNGNDRLLVFLDVDGDDQFGAADQAIDAFGELAVDPGSIWSDTTYRRCEFTPQDGSAAFDVSASFTSHAQNDAADYGTAPIEGCP